MPTKLILQQEKTLAAVGIYSPLPSMRDAEMGAYFMECLPLLYPDKEIVINADSINIEEGRDFLVEDKAYDIVMTFSCMHTPALPKPKTLEERAHLRSIAGPIWKMQVSDLHTVEQWRARFIATGAELIYLAHPIRDSLDGEAIGELPGYERRAHPNGAPATVYVREGL